MADSAYRGLKNNPEEAEFEVFSERKTCEVIKQTKNKGGEKYRCMIKDEILFTQIIGAVQHYLTPDSLKQIWHGYNTNINENMNHVVASFAPKHHHLW